MNIDLSKFNATTENFVLDKLAELVNPHTISNLDAYYAYALEKNKITTGLTKSVKFIVDVGLALCLTNITIDTDKMEDKFGFVGCFRFLLPCVKYENFTTGRKNKDITNVNQIYSVLVARENKECDNKDYTETSDVYKTDILSLFYILSPTSLNIENQELEKKLKSIVDGILGNKINKSVSTYNAILKERYKYILDAETNGIEKYDGVFFQRNESNLLAREAVQVIAVSNKNDETNRKAITISDKYTDTFLISLNDIVCDNLNIQVDKNAAHQFDLNEIYENTSKGFVTYYPYKMLEFVSLSQCTRRAKITYPMFKGDDKNIVASFDSYFNLIKEELKKLLVSYLYIVLTKHIEKNPNESFVKGIQTLLETKDFKNTKDREEILVTLLELVRTETLTYEDYISGRRTNNTNTDTNFYLSSFFTKNIHPFIDYFINCVSTFLCVAEYKAENIQNAQGDNETNILSFRVKICAPQKPNVIITTKQFVESKTLDKNGYKESNDSSGDKANFEDNLSPRQKIIVKENSEFNWETLQYLTKDIAYTPNSVRANAVPLFAYKALLQLQEKQGDSNAVKLSWGNILLGRDDQNNVVYSTMDKDKIALKQHSIHFLIAGSRSGKGVMGYNLFTTAISDEIPIFYMDGKPDTSVTMRYVSRMAAKGDFKEPIANEIFCVDNCLSSSNVDAPYKMFRDETRMFSSEYKPLKEQETTEHYSSIPPYINEVDKNTKQIWGMIAYYRGVMLPYAMCAYAYANPNTPFSKKWKAYTEKNGVLIVIDEVSNFIDEWKKVFAPGLDISKKVKSSIKADEVTDSVDKLKAEVLKMKSNLTKVEKKKGVTAEEINIAKSALENAERKLNETNKHFNKLNFEDIYWTQFYKSMINNCATLASFDRASNPTKCIQVLFIGQEFGNLNASLKCPLEASNYEINSSGGIAVVSKSSGFNMTPVIPWLNQIIKRSANGVDIIIGYNQKNPKYAGFDKGGVVGNQLNLIKRAWGYRAMGNLADNFDDVMLPSKSNPEVDYTFFRPYLILNDSATPETKYLPYYEDGTGGTLTKKDYENMNLLADNREKYCQEGAYVAQCLSNVERALGSGDDMTEMPAEKIAEIRMQGWDMLRKENQVEGSTNPKGNTLHKGIGFEGYIKMINEKALQSLGQSGELAQEFIKEVYNYDGLWQEFVDDMRPEYMIDLSALNSKSFDLSKDLSVFLQDSVKQAVSNIFNSNIDKAKDYLGSLYAFYFADSNNTTVHKENEPNIQQPTQFNNTSYYDDDEPENTSVKPQTQVKDVTTIVVDFYNKYVEHMANAPTPIKLEFIPKLTDIYLEDTYLAHLVSLYKIHRNTDVLKKDIIEQYKNNIKSKIKAAEQVQINNSQTNTTTQQAPKPQTQPIQTKVTDTTTTTSTEQTQTKPQTQVQDTNIEMQLKIQQICTLVIAGMVNSGIRVSKKELVHTLYEVITEHLGNVTTEEYLLNFFKMLV